MNSNIKNVDKCIKQHCSKETNEVNNKEHTAFINSIVSKFPTLKTKDDYLALYETFKSNSNSIITFNNTNCSMKYCKRTFKKSIIDSFTGINKHVKNKYIPEFMSDVIFDTDKILKKSKYNKDDILKITFNLLLIIFFTFVGAFGNAIIKPKKN